MDDCFACIKKGERENILNELNAFHHSINFTYELEENNSLPFLDVLVMRNDNGSISKKVYRKKTHSGRYLNYGSYHHPSHKISAIDSLVYRALKICDPEFTTEELDTVTADFIKNGYPKSLIQRRIKKMVEKLQLPPQEKEFLPRFVLPYTGPLTTRLSKYLRSKLECDFGYIPGQKIKQIICDYKEKSPKDNIGVYMLKCSCNSKYIGEKARPLKTRVKEHFAAIKTKFPKSAVALHAKSNPTHIITEDSASLIHSELNYFPRKFMEALYIRKTPNIMNRDTGMTINPIWTSVLLPLIHPP